MTPDERERLRALEVQFQYHSQKLDVALEELKRISTILEQAKGARYIVMALWIGFGGTLSTIIWKVLALVGVKIGS